MNDEVLAVVNASTPRRYLGVGMLAVVGGIVLYVAFAAPPSAAWFAFLLVVGVAALYVAARMWQATEHRIELTTEELRCSNGTVIARVEDLEAVDRGFFAFKPSNGFLLKTGVSQSRAWMPGLWWRMGRRIGIGGVTPGSQSKAMAEIIAALLVQSGKVR
ncbi:MAG: hypothetical protein GJ676_04825 [Rhodobacteraceae bacterium]|nr:hypothetical protein [Paracoccaceae bacterium]